MSHDAVGLHRALFKRIAQGTTSCRDVVLLEELLLCMRRRYLIVGAVAGAAAMLAAWLVGYLVRTVDPAWLVLGAAYAMGVLWLSIPKEK